MTLTLYRHFEAVLANCGAFLLCQILSKRTNIFIVFLPEECSVASPVHQEGRNPHLLLGQKSPETRQETSGLQLRQTRTGSYWQLLLDPECSANTAQETHVWVAALIWSLFCDCLCVTNGMMLGKSAFAGISDKVMGKREAPHFS